MVFISRKGKGARKGGRGQRKAKKAPATKQATVALIKQVVAREEETKFASELIMNKTNFNSSIVNGDATRVLPKIVQDQGSGVTWERLGSKISVRKLTVHFDASLTDVARSTAIVVKYWILTHKEAKSYNAFSAVLNMSQLLKTGTTTELQGFNGLVQDAMLPVNNAKFNVLKTGEFLLGKNTGTVQDTSTAGNQPMYGNHLSKRWSVNLKCPKVFTYEQDSNSPRTVYFPSGYAPFVVFGYYHQNQTTPDELNADLTVTMRSSIYYDDA